MDTSSALPRSQPLPARVAIPVIAALVALVYHRTFATLWATWTTNDNYSHGPLVPVVSLALLWRGRHRLREVPLAPDARGLLLVALGCLLQVTGVRADLFALQGWSLLVLLFGLALTFGGMAVTRRVAFPIAFLAFMLTFPPLLVNQVSFALKEVAVSLSTAAADLLGVLYRRHGMTLHLAGGDLRIEHPCSGLRSLIALLAIGALLAGTLSAGWPRRLALFLSAVPIAIAVNAIRLTLLIVVAHYAGVPAVQGAVHDVSGYALYALGLGALLLVRRVVAPRAAGDAAARAAA